jgi:type 2 lantibiotic biosynthesis protein LanM
MTMTGTQEEGRPGARGEGTRPRGALPPSELWRGLYLRERVQWLRRTGYRPVSKNERRAFGKRFEALVSAEEHRHWKTWRSLQRITVDEHVAAARPHPPTRRCPLAPQSWWRTLAEVLATEDLNGPHEGPGASIEGIQRLLGPFVVWATRGVERSLAAREWAAARVDAPRLSAGLTADLVSELARAANRTLILELNIARVEGQLQGDTPPERVQSFTDGVLASPERLRALYLRYPALARLLATRCHSWLRGVREMLAAYAADRAEIQARIFGGQDPGPLVGLGKESGDPHDGGRRVRILEFESGARVVFKPRPLEIDALFQSLVAWINGNGLAAKLPTLEVVRRPTHGWTSWAAAAPAADREAVRRFYYRVGALLPVLWVIRGTDFHYENVIASGDAPVLIDLEMLFANDTATAMPGEPPAQKLLRRSVLEAGILPSQPLSATRDRPSEDVSAIGKRNGQTWRSDFEIVRNAGTDEARMERGSTSLPASPNLPRIGSNEVTIVGFEQDLLSGLRDAYLHLERNRGALLHPGGPLAGASRIPVRFVMRPTIQYGILMDRACHPNRLGDALHREYYLAPRLAAFLRIKPRLRSIVAREFHELIDGDVPRFSTFPGSRSLWRSDGGEVKAFFRSSALALCRDRIRSLSAAALSFQHEIARLSVSTLSVGLANRPVEHEAPSSPAAVAPEDLAEEARRIGRWCREMAVLGEGEAEWFGLTQNKELQSMVAPSGAFLYGGAAGLSLFLAYLSRFDPARGVRDLALAGARLTRRALAETPTAGGAFDGRGGMAYALLHVGTVLGRPELTEEALSHLLDLGDQAKRDDTHDLIGGSAGMIGVLLAFAEATGSTRALDVAAVFGRHLVEKRLRVDGGCGWPNPIASRQPLTGAAHGAAGISWALIRLAHATGLRQFEAVGREGLRYEQSLFDPRHRNWPELRQNASHGAGDGPMAWCYGAPGIGLSRTTLPARSIGEVERSEIETVLDRMSDLPLHPSDSLCHGELGNLETLVAASLRLDRPHLLQAARERAGRALLRRRNAGYWRSGLEGTHEQVPGLFLGMAGVGYQLLRLVDPARVPSVLTLEVPRSVQP